MAYILLQQQQEQQEKKNQKEKCQTAENVGIPSS